MPEQALGGIPLVFGIVVKDKPSKLSCIPVTKVSCDLGCLLCHTDGMIHCHVVHVHVFM